MTKIAIHHLHNGITGMALQKKNEWHFERKKRVRF